MRKLIGYFLRLSVSLAALVMLTNCGDDVDDANLFVQYIDANNQIYMVKALEPGQNAGYGKNIFGESLGIKNIDGKDYYAFKLKPKVYDIYIEWDEPTGWRLSNNRSSVNLKANDWCKLIWNSDSFKYRVLDGTGEVY